MKSGCTLFSEMKNWSPTRIAIKDEYKYLLSSQQKLMGKALLLLTLKIIPLCVHWAKKNVDLLYFQPEKKNKNKLSRVYYRVKLCVIYEKSQNLSSIHYLSE